MSLIVSEKKKILYAVLNWGLGHATRSLPIIQYLKKKGHQLHIASDGLALQFLKKECQGFTFSSLPGYDVHYADTRLFVGMIKQGPKILSAIRKERKIIKAYVEQNDIDLIISDSRFGCYDPKLPSFLIGHILQLPLSDPITNFAANKTLRRWINRFDRCWVPDHPPPRNLSGYLSHARLNVEKDYLGWLTNLEPQKGSKSYDLVAVLSGPEPLRSTFEKKIIEQLKEIEGQFLVIGGTPDARPEGFISPNIEYVPIATRTEMSAYLSKTEVVLGRSGYSSLMDWLLLGKKMIVVPTPSQPEQVFLAQELKNRNWAISQRQDKLNIRKAILGVKSVESPRFEDPKFSLFQNLIDQHV
jgi:uncharacterized protein (TIGR00661 family)